MSIPQKSYRDIIAANIQYLLKFFGISRKKLCADLEIKYTSFCDWINAKTYPKFDTLQLMGNYFHIDVRDFLIDIESNPVLVAKLTAYLKGLDDKEKKPDFECGEFSVSDYDELPEGYPVELLNGRFYMLSSPSAAHQRMVSEITVEISMYIRAHRGSCKVFPGPFDVELPTKHATVCSPDVTVVCKKGLVGEARCVGTPDWIIEVLSPSNSKNDTERKLALYGEAQVPEYWIVDMERECTCVYTKSEESASWYGPCREYSFEELIPVGIYRDFSIRMADLDYSV